jgi:hypothetical protein
MIFLSTIRDEMSKPVSTRYRLCGCKWGDDAGHVGVFLPVDEYNGAVYNRAGVYNGVCNTAYVDNYGRDSHGGDVWLDSETAYDTDIVYRGSDLLSSNGFAGGPIGGIWKQCIAFVWGCCDVDLFCRPPTSCR